MRKEKKFTKKQIKKMKNRVKRKMIIERKIRNKEIIHHKIRKSQQKKVEKNKIAILKILKKF